MDANNIEFEVSIVDHCNLNCAYCANFSNLAPKKFLKIEDFERDMKRLGKIFVGKCHHAKILGGEPLLHTNYLKFLKTARKYFSGRISIITNGLLLKEEEIKDLIKYKIDLIVSKYPIKLNYKKFDYHNVEDTTNFYRTRRIFEEKSMFEIRSIDLTGGKDPNISSSKCKLFNKCVTLKNGRLYTCSFAPNVEFFSKYFNKDIYPLESDSIDIYKEGLTKEEIFEFTKKPISLCKYCNIDRNRLVPWKKTEFKIEEYI